MRQWRPRLEEINREARQFGGGVRGKVKQVALRARMHHETLNRLILTDFCNTFNAVKPTVVLTEVATCVPALIPFVAKCYGEYLHPPVLFQMDSGEGHKIDFASGVQHGDAMGLALFCMPLLLVLKRTREEFEPKCGEAFAYLDDVSIGTGGVTSDTVDVVPFLQRELASIGIAMNPRKTAALPPKGHVPTLEEIARLESVDVRVVERGGVKVVGVPLGTDAYAMESAMEIVENSGAEQLTRMLPHIPDKQSANLIATGSMLQRLACVGRVMDPQ